MARTRDYKAEYVRRTANAEQRGLSRSQGRGHARTGEAPIKGGKAISNERLEDALKILRRDHDQTAAAKALNIAPERFRRFLRENVEIVGRGRNLKIIDNRPREMTVVSDGQASVVKLRDYDQASLNGEHWAAIKEFVATNDRDLLEPFEGRSVIDTKGNAHPLETDPNTLHRIVNQDDPRSTKSIALFFMEANVTENDLAREQRRQSRLERLCTNDPLCGACGERDDRCLELHHLAGRKHDDFLVINCRNCHRKVSDDQKDYPAFDPNADKLLATIGHFLLGLADMLKLIIEKLYEFGRALVERAKPVAECGQ